MGDTAAVYPPEHVWREMTVAQKRFVIDGTVELWKLIPFIAEQTRSALEEF